MTESDQDQSLVFEFNSVQLLLHIYTHDSSTKIGPAHKDSGWLQTKKIETNKIIKLNIKFVF